MKKGNGSICCGGFRIIGNVAYCFYSTKVHLNKNREERLAIANELRKRGVTKITEGQAKEYIDIDVFFNLVEEAEIEV